MLLQSDKLLIYFIYLYYFYLFVLYPTDLIKQLFTSGSVQGIRPFFIPKPQPPTPPTPPASRGSCVVSFTFCRSRDRVTKWSITYWSCSRHPKLIFCLLPQSINSCIYSGCFDGHCAISFIFHVSEVYGVISDNAILGRSRNRFPFQENTGSV